ncbi:hypothetical protein HMPREF9104_01234 [Lentilactobacillus kisonensis F0435]|uniref:Uncharacterized protein n=1 Tax=Lentilactobacillus kisonensis F0435 TaxID=797516 RepID=H1LF58_9LACO|nr:hypothetical protein HMPREF9104_01234 [Lentilactobacillus kisonensis F0435]
MTIAKKRVGHTSFHSFVMATLITTFILIKSATNGRSLPFNKGGPLFPKTGIMALLR